MDVITILQPENHINRPLIPVSRQTRVRSVKTALSPSFSFVQEMPVASSFPFLFLIFLTVLISATPLFQQRFGFYRLERISFPNDTQAESAMRMLSTPESDASLLAGSGETVLPVSMPVVSYSTYKVRNGDTVSAILSRSGLRNLSTILSANNIENAKHIRSGQTLTIPSIDGIIYKVVRGDSLSRISSRYAIPVTAILDANDLTSSTLVPGSHLFIPGVSLSVKDLRRALGELFSLPLHGRLTSRFGYRKDPFTGVRTYHTGIDLAAPYGTLIKSTMDGKVATTGYSSVFGNYAIITHDDGYQSLYGHMSSITVKRGQKVAQGAVVGKVGNTGYSTGCHLHFSIYKNGKMIDPYSVL